MYMIITESDNHIFVKSIAISITEAARNFSDCVNRVAYKGERFTLLRGKKAVAELHPAAQGRRLAELPALLEGLPPMGDGEAGRLGRDVGLARKERRAERPRNPWDS